MLLINKNMSGIFTCMDQDEWNEIKDRHVHSSGNVYAGKEYREGYEVKVFVRRV
jgi:hypothetical protein